MAANWKAMPPTRPVSNRPGEEERMPTESDVSTRLGTGGVVGFRGHGSTDGLNNKGNDILQWRLAHLREIPVICTYARTEHNGI